MFKVVGKQNLTQTIRRVDILAEDLVTRIKPGHFIAIALDARSRLVPLNIFDIDWRRKCISVVFEEADADTRRLGALKINDEVALVAGPFGVPVRLEKTPGAVVMVGEGLGLSSIVLLSRSFKQAGAKVIGLVGFSSRKEAILENQMRLNCSKFQAMYQDGSHDRRGDVLGPLNKMIKEEAVSRIYADASFRTVEAVVRIAHEKNIPVFFNIMELVAGRAFFSPTGSLLLGSERYLPAVQGIIVGADRASPAALAREAEGLKEYAGCRRKEAELSRRSSVGARLKKFFWG